MDCSGGKRMNVCIDVGNTTIAFGFYKNNKIQCKMVHNTIVNRTEDEYVVLLNNTLSSLKIEKNEIERIIYSSVVPSINQPFKAAISRVLNVEVLSVGPGIKTGLNIKIDNPEVVLFMIIELTSSTCFSCIMKKEPLSIKEYKPYLYKAIKKLLEM